MNSRIYKRYAQDRDIVLVRGDCEKHIRRLPTNSVDLTITSPPYCMGKEYEDTKDVGGFVYAHRRLLPEIVRVTKNGGSICWQVGYHVKNSVVTPLDFLVHEIMSNQDDVYLRNRVIWIYGHGLHGTKRFSGRHEVILWYTKGKDYHFNLDEVRVPQKYPGKRHYKGKNKGEYSGNPLGKNPSDIWDIPNVKANHVEKTEHPCQFPIALAQRLIRALSPKKGMILDPYMGSGTTAAAAILEGRKVLGFEIADSYMNIARKRCEEAVAGSLGFRPAEKPIYKPGPNIAVARRT